MSPRFPVAESCHVEVGVLLDLKAARPPVLRSQEHQPPARGLGIEGVLSVGRREAAGIGDDPEQR